MYLFLLKRQKRGEFFPEKIRDFGKKGGQFEARIREKGGEIGSLEHEYVPFWGPSGGAGSITHYLTTYTTLLMGVPKVNSRYYWFVFEISGSYRLYYCKSPVISCPYY